MNRPRIFASCVIFVEAELGTAHAAEVGPVRNTAETRFPRSLYAPSGVHDWRCVVAGGHSDTGSTIRTPHGEGELWFVQYHAEPLHLFSQRLPSLPRMNTYVREPPTATVPIELSMSTPTGVPWFHQIHDEPVQ